MYFFDSARIWIGSIGNLKLFENNDIPTILVNLGYAKRDLNNVQDFLLKYEQFFSMVKKFGIIIDTAIYLKPVTEAKQETEQLTTIVAQGKLDIAEKMYDELSSKLNRLRNELPKLISLPHIIDYSKLTNRDWRIIGIAGIHYKSRVFLSYPFRDNDPKKDENQQMIDNYIKPTIEMLNIAPVTARDYLRPQELVDDKIMELVEDCDGILGFYTNDDSIENVEHELSKSQNIVAICREDRARGPSMRRSRFQIDFKRKEMGDLVMGVIKALKESKLFNLSL